MHNQRLLVGRQVAHGRLSDLQNSEQATPAFRSKVRAEIDS